MPAHAIPQGRGGHPQLREPGGGWGEFAEQSVFTGARPSAPPGRTAPRVPSQRSRPGPRQEYVDAFDEDDDVFAPRRTGGVPAQLVDVRDTETQTASGEPPATEAGGAESKESGKGRTFTGIAAAAVTTALAVVVAGQVADGHGNAAEQSQSAIDQDRESHGSAVAGDG
ncbi:MAG: hypothetical protein LBV60_06575, partial [Streptomyces sp.]|nr:hypothetical protein [Streptomyces sp.]